MSTRPEREALGRLMLIPVLQFAVVVTGGITIAVRHADGPGPRADRSTPASATNSYYAALVRDDPKTAYSLLCPRAQTGYAAYSALVAREKSSGTAVSAFRPTGAVTVKGTEAAVAATVTLADGTSTPIIVLLLRQSDRWAVCSSNLGGVLPPPGPAPAATSTTGPPVAT